MSRLWSLLISAMLLFTLGAAQLPKRCAGDAQGAPCTMTTCVCIDSCTCRLAHLKAALQPSACCVPTVESACHTPEAPSHLALPQKHWYGLAPAYAPFALRTFEPARRHTPWQALRLGHPDLLLPEKPPRRLA